MEETPAVWRHWRQNGQNYIKNLNPLSDLETEIVRPYGRKAVDEEAAISTPLLQRKSETKRRNISRKVPSTGNSF